MKTPAEMLFNSPLLPVKQRNTILDSLFYDTGSLTPEEVKDLSLLAAREGSIIVVPPTSAHQPIRHYKKALRFMNNEGERIRAIAVAGVGSSVLGTAALARNVADARGFDVAGIVTGYGVSDLMTEALGGWFVFGMADRMRLRVEDRVETLASTLPDKVSGEDGEKGISFASGFNDLIANTPDVATLVDVLLANPPNLELLVGHSKGNLLIDFVMERFVEELEGEDHPLYERLNVVTLGAVVSLPWRFAKVRQIMGELDWFGGLNSRKDLPYEKVPGAWHHLNPQFPYHLDIGRALRSELAVTSP